MSTLDDTEEADPYGGRPSKSARKREAATLQDLGVELAGLPDEEIDSLDLPETLSTALRELRRLTSHGAQLRQRQYIGKLMRKIDPQPIVDKLEARKLRHTEQIRHFQMLERWRDRLLAEPDATLGEFLAEHPGGDRATLAPLIARAVQERSEQRPPAAARELFVYLRRLLG